MGNSFNESSPQGNHNFRAEDSMFLKVCQFRLFVHYLSDTSFLSLPGTIGTR
jgi:hypothetical protein